MFIKKILFKDGVTSVSYEDGDQTVTIKSSESPRDSLIMCLEKLKAPLFRNIGIRTRDELEKDYKDVSYADVKTITARTERDAVSVLFDVCGILHDSSEKKGVSFKILALFSNGFAKNVVKTSAMFLPVGESSETDPEHLTQEETDTLTALLREAEAFISGAREQGQLFDSEGEPTEEADNEEAEEF